jgi:acyl-CoA thioesterase
MNALHADADAAALAQACAASMYTRDVAAQALGIVLEEVAPGFARMSMTVRPDMANGHAICHGGFLFTLADTCFAFACNTFNRVTVAQAASIDFLRPVAIGERLQAEARMLHQGGRSGVYDVGIHRADGTLVAAFRGNSASLDKAVIEPQEQ